MARKTSWESLSSRLKEGRRKRDNAEVERLPAGLPLPEVRRRRHVTQEVLARSLGAKQATVSRLERQEDLLLSTLRNYIEAIGGELEVVARFPGGEAHRLRFTP